MFLNCHRLRISASDVLFDSAKSNSDRFTISNFSSFFKNFVPYTAQVRKVKSAKNHFLVLFYSAKSISDHFTISELFQIFFKKSIFLLFRTLYWKGKNDEVRKKSFLVLFYSAKSNSDLFIFQIFQVFSKNVFLLFRPLYCTGEKNEIRKKSFLVLFYSAKSNSDHVTISNFSCLFFEKLILLLFRPLF